MEEKKYFLPKEQWNRLIAKVWADDDFRNELISNTNATLEKEGVKIPEGMTVHIVDEWQPSTPSDFYFVLRNPNDEASIKKSEARKAASGMDSTGAGDVKFSW